MRTPKPTAIEPRRISASEAAAYCGLTPSGIRAWVARGTLPTALPGTRRWDRHAIDAALDRISGLAKDGAAGEGEDDLGRWLREHGKKYAPVVAPGRQA